MGYIMEYKPDRWVVIKITTEKDVLYKVFATWLSGYLDGDNWRMNSGITKVEEDGDYWLFYGTSDSIYRCHKDGIGTSGYTGAILNGLVKRAKKENITIEIMKKVNKRIDYGS
jgi:hypothetical protein